MKRKTLSVFTRRLIKQNEQAIKIRKLHVAKELNEIEELQKQNRELIGRNQR